MEDEEMNDLVLTGPYRGISAYGNFAIQVDMPSSATSRSGDADGPITWNVTWRPQQNKVMNMEYCKRLASNNLCSKIWNGTCLPNQIIYIYIFLSHPLRNKTCMSSNAFFEHYMQENIHVKQHQVCIIYW